MRNATPVSVRRAIVRAHKKGLTYDEIGRLLGVGAATVSRVLRLAREERSVEPKPVRGGNYSPITGRVAELLVAIVGTFSDATVAELTEVLIRRSGVSTSRAGVQRALHRLGFSRKKSRSWQRSETRPSTDDTVGSSARRSLR
jgi:transposase